MSRTRQGPGAVEGLLSHGVVMRTVTMAALLSVMALVTVLGTTAIPAAAATQRVPQCPPDCGAFAAGDPLLVPFMIDNPGTAWDVLPEQDVRSYVTNLKRGIARIDRGRVLSNVVASRWVDGPNSLLIVLVSASSLAAPRLESPALNAQDLCSAAGGEPGGRLVGIPGVPKSVSGVCAIRSQTTYRVATVVAFNRADVAVLIQATSATGQAIDQRMIEYIAQKQFSALPSSGVLVSQGPDVALELVWGALFVLAAALVFGCVRRRGNWKELIQAISNAAGRRKVALGVSVLAVIGSMAFAMFESSLIHGFGRWYESGFNDFWRAWASSAYLTFGGGYGHIFGLDTALETAPTVELVVSPFARAALGLSFPYPGDVLYPTAFWVAGPLFLSAMALPICGADRWLQYLGVADLRRRLVVLGVMAITLPPIAFDGHPEDLIALGTMLYGLIAALRGRDRAAGWWLGVGLAFQFLTFLAVPLALVFVTRRRWLPTIGRMVLPTLAALSVPLATAPSSTIRQLLHQKVYDAFGYITPTWHVAPGFGASFRSIVALMAIPAAILLARLRPDDPHRAASLVLWILAILFALRVFEPELVPYFLAPPLALFVISAGRSSWWRLIATGALALWLTWWLKFPLQAHWMPWLFLIAQLAVLAWLGWPRGFVRHRDAPVVPARKQVRKSPAKQGGARRPALRPTPG